MLEYRLNTRPRKRFGYLTPIEYASRVALTGWMRAGPRSGPACKYGAPLERRLRRTGPRSGPACKYGVPLERRLRRTGPRSGPACKYGVPLERRLRRTGLEPARA